MNLILFVFLFIIILISILIISNNYNVDTFDNFILESNDISDNNQININYDSVHTLSLDTTYKKMFFDIFIRNGELFVIMPLYINDINFVKDISISLIVNEAKLNKTYKNVNCQELNLKSLITKNIDNLNKKNFIEPIIILIYDIYTNDDSIKINFQYKNLDEIYLLNNDTNITNKFNLTLTTLLKDDYKYFDLFYNYYIDQGIEFFYIYYNGKLNDDIKSFLSKPNVKVIEWDYQYWNDDSVDQTLKHHAQIGQKHHALYKYGKIQSKYMIFCDLDEFMFTPHRKLKHMINSKKDSYIFTNVWSKFIDPSETFPNKILISEEKYQYKNRSKCIHNVSKVIHLNIHYCSKYNDNKNQITIDTYDTNFLFHFSKNRSYKCKKIIELDFYSKPLLYIHIPKTGGSYVEDIFKMSGYLVGKFNEITLLGTPRNIIKKSYKCNKWHTPFKYKALVFNNSACEIPLENKLHENCYIPIQNISFKDYLTFTIIREPISRLISELNYKQFPKAYKHKETDINKFIVYYFNNLETNRKYDGDCHIVPQSDYLYDKFGNTIDNILKFDNLNQELSAFIKKFHLNIKLSDTKVNQKAHNYKISDITKDNLDLVNRYYIDDTNLYYQL